MVVNSSAVGYTLMVMDIEKRYAALYIKICEGGCAVTALGAAAEKVGKS